MRLALLLLPLVLVAATVSFHPDENVTIDKQRFNTTVSGQSLIMVGEYYTVLLHEGKCENKDIYVYCLDNVTFDRVEYYPHTHEVELTWQKLCTDCSRFGAACERRVDCSAYCVHEVCRPASTWCGDGFCDESEACAVDCPVNETVSENVSVVENVSIEEPSPEPIRPTPEEREAAREEFERQTSPPWTGIGVVIGGGAVLILFIFGRKPKEPDVL